MARASSLVEQKRIIADVDPPQLGEVCSIACKSWFYTDPQGHEFVSLERPNNQLSKALYPDLYQLLSNVGIIQQLDPPAGIEPDDRPSIAIVQDSNLISETACVGSDGTIYVPHINASGTVVDVQHRRVGQPEDDFHTGYATSNMVAYRDNIGPPVSCGVKGDYGDGWLFFTCDDSTTMITCDLSKASGGSGLYSAEDIDVRSQTGDLDDHFFTTGAFVDGGGDVLYQYFRANNGSLTNDYLGYAMVRRIDVSSGTPVITKIYDSQDQLEFFTHIQSVNGRLFALGLAEGAPTVPTEGSEGQLKTYRIYEYVSNSWVDRTGTLSFLRNIRQQLDHNSWYHYANGFATSFTYADGKFYVGYKDTNYGGDYRGPGTAASVCRVGSVVKMSDWSHEDIDIGPYRVRRYLLATNSMGPPDVVWEGAVSLTFGAYDGERIEVDLDLDAHTYREPHEWDQIANDHVSRIEGMTQVHSVRYMTINTLNNLLSGLEAGTGAVTGAFPHLHDLEYAGNTYEEWEGRPKSNVQVDGWTDRMTHMHMMYISEAADQNIIGFSLELSASESTVFTIPTYPRWSSIPTDHLYMRIK